MLKLANITSVYRSKLIVQAYRDWVKPNQKVVDVGCGTGVVASEIAKRLRLKVVGCDIEKYLICKISFKKMTKENRLPFKSNSFDVAMFNDVLHHTSRENQIKLIKDSFRVSKKVLIFEVIPNIPGKIADFIINKIHNPNMEIPFTYRDVTVWLELFKKLNLRCKTKIVDKPFFYPFSHVAFCATKDSN